MNVTDRATEITEQLNLIVDKAESAITFASGRKQECAQVFPRYEREFAELVGAKRAKRLMRLTEGVRKTSWRVLNNKPSSRYRSVDVSEGNHARWNLRSAVLKMAADVALEEHKQQR